MNKIEFTENVELEVVEAFDEKRDQITASCTEDFKVGETVDVELIEGTDPSLVDIQFGDGSVAHSVSRSVFKILPN